MGQTRVLSIVSEYLRQASPNETKLRNLLSQGHCFAFSLLFSAMAALNLFDWWVAFLLALEIWNGEASQLKNSIRLPPSQDITLEDLLFRALNYFVFHQGYYKTITASDVRYTNMLDPVARHFKIFDANDRLHQIGARETISGHFTDEHLHSLFTEDFIQSSLCLVTNTTHAICVVYARQQWIVYDPNYDHTQQATLFKICDSKQAMIEEVILILGRAINIDVAWFEGQPTPSQSPFVNFEANLTTDTAISLLQNGGLNCVLSYSARLFPKIFDLVTENYLGCRALSGALLFVPPCGWSGLLKLAISAPEYLTKIPYILDKQDFIHNLLRVLGVEVPETKDTNFSMLIKYTGSTFKYIFNLVLTVKDAPETLIKYFAQQNSKGKSALTTLFIYQSDYLSYYLTALKQTDSLSGLLISELSKTNKKFKCTYFHYVSSHSQQALPLILTILLNSPMTQQNIIDLFLTPDQYNVTILEKIKTNAASYFHAVVGCVAKIDLIGLNRLRVVSFVLENALSSKHQHDILAGMLSYPNNLSLELIHYLPDNYGVKRQLTLQIITHLFAHAKTPCEVSDVLARLNTQQEFSFLKKIAPLRSVFANNIKVSATWVRIQALGATKIESLTRLSPRAGVF